MCVEEITKKSLKGEERNYVLQGGPSSSTTVLLSEIDGEVFKSADDARNTLVSRATSQIEKIVDAAILKSKEWYETEAVNDEVLYNKNEIPQEEKEQVKVKLPDGTIANLRL